MCLKVQTSKRTRINFRSLWQPISKFEPLNWTNIIIPLAYCWRYIDKNLSGNTKLEVGKPQTRGFKARSSVINGTGSKENVVVTRRLMAVGFFPNNIAHRTIRKRIRVSSNESHPNHRKFFACGRITATKNMSRWSDFTTIGCIVPIFRKRPSYKPKADFLHLSKKVA